MSRQEWYAFGIRAAVGITLSVAWGLGWFILLALSK